MSAPLAKTDQVVIMGGGSGVTSEISKLVGQLPPAVQALTGYDISEVNRIRRAKNRRVRYTLFFLRLLVKFLELRKSNKDAAVLAYVLLPFLAAIGSSLLNGLLATVPFNRSRI